MICSRTLTSLALFFVLLAPAAADTAAEPAAEALPAKPRLGMNLNGPADWNSELPFVDVFRLSRPWISQKEGATWGKGPELELDAHGWVKRLEPDCWAETPLCTISGGHYPGGKYTVLYDGRGELDFGIRKPLTVNCVTQRRRSGRRGSGRGCFAIRSRIQIRLGQRNVLAIQGRLWGRPIQNHRQGRLEVVCGRPLPQRGSGCKRQFGQSPLFQLFFGCLQPILTTF